MILKRFSNIVQGLVNKTRREKPIAGPSMLITEENKSQLPPNIALLNGNNIAKHLKQLDDILRASPINFVATNVFSEDEKLVQLKAYLQTLSKNKKLQSCIFLPHSSQGSMAKDIDEYIDNLGRKLPRSLYDQDKLSTFANMLKGYTSAVFNACSRHELTLEIRNGTTEKSYYPHIDRSTIIPEQQNAEEFNRQFLGQEIKSIMPLAGTSTAIFDNLDLDNQKHINKTPLGLKTKLNRYDLLPCGHDMHSKASWHLPQLGIGFFPCENWPHMPAAHSVPLHPQTSKQARTLLITHITPRSNV